VFSVANAMTLLVYGALGSMTFFLVLQLQVTTGYSPLEAGVALLPITVAMLLLSPSSGALAARIGPRWQLSIGPLLCAIGVLMLRGVDEESGYLTGVLPGVTVFALGLTSLVAPLTSSVLATAPDRFAGVASGINNAVARSGSLLAVAALPTIVGITGEDYQRPGVFSSGYSEAMLIGAALLAVGGVLSFVGLRPVRSADLRARDAPAGL
jgi:MFS family permease